MSLTDCLYCLLTSSDKQTVTHAGMKFSQTINPLSLIAFLLLRKVHCAITRKTEPLNYFDIPKFIKALESGLHFPLTLDWFKCSTAPKKSQKNGCILVTSSSLRANGRQKHCCFSNCRSCFGLMFRFITWDAILYIHIEGKKVLTGHAKYTRLTKLLKTSTFVLSKLMLVICRSWFRVCQLLLNWPSSWNM